MLSDHFSSQVTVSNIVIYTSNGSKVVDIPNTSKVEFCRMFAYPSCLEVTIGLSRSGVWIQL